MSTITVKVPFTVRQRGGRKVVIAPDGAEWAPARPQVDSTLVKALARAFRWRRMLESGRYGTVTELAAAEKVNSSYLCRVLRLTPLAREIVEAVLDGRRPEMTLDDASPDTPHRPVTRRPNASDRRRRAAITAQACQRPR